MVNSIGHATLRLRSPEEGVLQVIGSAPPISPNRRGTHFGAAAVRWGATGVDTAAAQLANFFTSPVVPALRRQAARSPKAAAEGVDKGIHWNPDPRGPTFSLRAHAAIASGLSVGRLLGAVAMHSAWPLGRAVVALSKCRSLTARARILDAADLKGVGPARRGAGHAHNCS
jgi:hypothetical protein